MFYSQFRQESISFTYVCTYLLLYLTIKMFGHKILPCMCVCVCVFYANWLLLNSLDLVIVISVFLRLLSIIGESMVFIIYCHLLETRSR